MQVEIAVKNIYIKLKKAERELRIFNFLSLGLLISNTILSFILERTNQGIIGKFVAMFMTFCFIMLFFYYIIFLGYKVYQKITRNIKSLPGGDISTVKINGTDSDSGTQWFIYRGHLHGVIIFSFSFILTNVLIAAILTVDTFVDLSTIINEVITTIQLMPLFGVLFPESNFTISTESLIVILLMGGCFFISYSMVIYYRTSIRTENTVTLVQNIRNTRRFLHELYEFKSMDSLLRGMLILLILFILMLSSHALVLANMI